MTKTPQQEYQENLDFVRFLGGVAGSLNDINSKVVEGRLRSENFDIKQLALAHDKAKNLDQPILAQSNGVQPPQQGIPVQIPPQLIPAPQQPIATPSQNADFTLNDDQLLLPFDKKYSLNDIFSKIDDVYRKVISLENEIYKLRETLDNKKKDL